MLMELDAEIKRRRTTRAEQTRNRDKQIRDVAMTARQTEVNTEIKKIEEEAAADKVKLQNELCMVQEQMKGCMSGNSGQQAAPTPVPTPASMDASAFMEKKDKILEMSTTTSPLKEAVQVVNQTNASTTASTTAASTTEAATTSTQAPTTTILDTP